MTIPPTVGILSPGDMGHAIGSVLRQHGLRVLTNLEGRSLRTASLAAEAGITDVADDQVLVREVDIVLSIVAPSLAYSCAERVTKAVQATQSSLLYVDCNAIAPATMRAIEELVMSSGTSVVDVGIIGPPPRPGSTGTRLYAAGAAAQQLAILSEYGLEIPVFGAEIGQASGLKMCYASLTKGLTALATQAFTAGHTLNVTDALLHELRLSQHAMLQWIERQVLGMPPKARRWVGEMEEIARTFADTGLPPQLMQGAAALYRLIGQTDLGTEIPEQRRLGQSLEDVCNILAASFPADHK